MPVKNAGLYLEDCLRSIVDQTYDNFELLAVDDHSADDSFEILSAFSKRYPYIIINQNKGSGIIDALNQGYADSSGELITRMDADDIMDKDKIFYLSHKLIKQGIGNLALGKVSYFSSEELGDGYKKYAKWLNDLTDLGSNFTDRYKECVIPSTAWMAYREDFNQCGGFDSQMYPEDYDLCFRFYGLGIRPIPSEKVVHYWRDHPTRSSRTMKQYSDNSFLKLKMHYFFLQESLDNRDLVLWGAGKKGKRIALQINERRQKFDWLTNNSKKIGHEIHSNVLLNEANFELRSNQVHLVAVANENEQMDIMNKLERTGFEKGRSYFALC